MVQKYVEGRLVIMEERFQKPDAEGIDSFLKQAPAGATVVITILHPYDCPENPTQLPAPKSLSRIPANLSIDLRPVVNSSQPFHCQHNIPMDTQEALRSDMLFERLYGPTGIQLSRYGIISLWDARQLGMRQLLGINQVGAGQISAIIRALASYQLYLPVYSADEMNGDASRLLAPASFTELSRFVVATHKSDGKGELERFFELNQIFRASQLASFSKAELPTLQGYSPQFLGKIEEILWEMFRFLLPD